MTRCALKRLSQISTLDGVVEEARVLAELHLNRRQSVAFQWVPAHVGGLGSALADRLAADAHRLPDFVSSPPDH